MKKVYWMSYWLSQVPWRILPNFDNEYSIEEISILVGWFIRAEISIKDIEFPCAEMNSAFYHRICMYLNIIHDSRHHLTANQQIHNGNYRNIFGSSVTVVFKLLQIAILKVTLFLFQSPWSVGVMCWDGFWEPKAGISWEMAVWRLQFVCHVIWVE